MLAAPGMFGHQTRNPLPRLLTKGRRGTSQNTSNVNCYLFELIYSRKKKNTLMQQTCDFTHYFEEEGKGI